MKIKPYESIEKLIKDHPVGTVIKLDEKREYEYIIILEWVDERNKADSSEFNIRANVYFFKGHYSLRSWFGLEHLKSMLRTGEWKIVDK